MCFPRLFASENAKKKTYQGLPLISVSERRWFVFFYPRGKDKGKGGVARCQFDATELQVTKKLMGRTQLSFVFFLHFSYTGLDEHLPYQNIHNISSMYQYINRIPSFPSGSLRFKYLYVPGFTFFSFSLKRALK